MNAFRRRLFGHGHKYALLGQRNGSPEASLWTRKHLTLVIMLVALGGFAAVVVSRCVLPLVRDAFGHFAKQLHSASGLPANSGLCDTVAHGYECQPKISHFWGQYSPYFSAASEISSEIPAGCSITFAQMLSRHGARDPTASKTAAYNATFQKIQANVSKFKGKYAFLADYEYTLGAGQLTVFGQQELVNSGIKYYRRYEQLTREYTPFVRSSGKDRVVESAQNWTQGFRSAKMSDEDAKHGSNAYPSVNVIIPEADYGVNNTLNHGLCTEFENGTYSTISDAAEGTWANIFAKPIQERLNAHLPGAGLSIDETIYIMDLCPFNTVASPAGKISPFCALFTEEEWHRYSYYESLDKWYGYSYGNPLGPTQGVGFANELIARMTNEPVHDHTSTNRTLDDSRKTFPLGRQLYADFR